MRITNDPDVFSVERDCYSQLNASSPPKFKGVVRDSSPDLHKVARRLSVQGDAPWGLDRIDTAGEPAVRSWRQQHHLTAAMALASRTAAPAATALTARLTAAYDGPPLVLPGLLPSSLAPVQAARSTAAMTTAT